MKLGEVFAWKQQCEHAIEIYDFVTKVWTKLIGAEKSIYHSFILQMKAECWGKLGYERKIKPFEKAIEIARESLEMYETIIGKTKEGPEVLNNVLVKVIHILAELLRDAKQYAEAEALHTRAQTMIGIIHGEDHPAIIASNNCLVACRCVKFNKEKEGIDAETQATVLNIIEKNLEIAVKAYGFGSIYMVSHISRSLTNKISIGIIKAPPQANPMIKQMREIITEFHGGDPRQLSNQHFFTQQLLYTSLLESANN